MSISDQQPAPSLPPESEPAPPPSVPPAGVLWGDSDIGVPLLPPPVVAPVKPKEEKEPPPDSVSTIGHIGRYALKRLIGEGGLGTVYAAHDPLLSRLIAIKTLNVEIAADQRAAFNAMFLNEARAAAGLSHPNIVTVFDAGISDDNAYIAMELLKGRDLRQLRQEGWKPTPAQAALIVRRVADALAYAHSKGVVHRDIKPANIFMVGRTQPRVLDFGIARVAHQHEAHATGEEVAAGSPYYMAPEQIRQQATDRRTDVFSLGVVLYELLTEQKPFRGNSLGEITSAVLEHQPTPAHEIAKDVPKALSDIAARAMEKDPNDRFRSARSLSRELRHWLDEHGQASEAQEAAAAQRSRRAMWAGVAVAAVVMSAAAWWAGAHRQASQAAPAEPVAVAPAAAPANTPAASSVALASPSVAAPAATDTPAPSDAAASAAAAAPAMAAAPSADNAAAADTTAAPDLKNTAAKETARERRARERDARAAGSAAGLVRLAVSPWGHVEVDGTPVGTTPPLNEITLSEGRHQITVRNADFAPYTANVNVSSGQPVTLKHKFGS